MTTSATGGRGGPAPPPIPLEWRQPIHDYSLFGTAAGHSMRTVAARSKAIARLGRELGCAPASVTTAMLVQWFGSQRWAPETRRSHRAAVRGFYEWATTTGLIADDPAAALPAVRIPPATPRPVPDDLWLAALAAAPPRTRLMMRLAAEAGLRRTEVAQVHARDLIAGTGGAQLVVNGKGGRTRVVPISDDLAAVLRAGAGGHSPELAAYGSGYLFPGNEDGHLSAHHIGKLVARALPAGWSMHKLRHRFATRAFRGSRNLLAVQTLLGHSSVATTQRYTACDDDEIRAAAMAASVCTPAP